MFYWLQNAHNALKTTLKRPLQTIWATILSNSTSMVKTCKGFFRRSSYHRSNWVFLKTNKDHNKNLQWTVQSAETFTKLKTQTRQPADRIMKHFLVGKWRVFHKLSRGWMSIPILFAVINGATQLDLKISIYFVNTKITFP